MRERPIESAIDDWSEWNISLHHTRLNKLEKWNQYYINLGGTPSRSLRFYLTMFCWSTNEFIRFHVDEHKKSLLKCGLGGASTKRLCRQSTLIFFFRMDFTHLSKLFSRPVISGLRRRKWQFIYKKAIKWFSAFVSMLNVKHDISFRLENEKPFGVITVAFVWDPLLSFL